MTSALPDLRPAALAESDRLEVQEAAEPAAAAQAVAAFLNSEGGTLLIGIGAEQQEAAVVGVPDAAARADAVREAIRDRVLPHAAVTVNIVRTEENARLIVVDVPKGTEGPYLFDERIFVRRGAVTAVASPAEILQIVERRHGEERWERQLALGTSLGDLAAEEVLHTATEARQRRLVELGDRPGEVLTALSLAEDDEVRNGAVVLFGHNPARLYPQTRLRVARFEDEGGDRFLDNRVFEGHAFDLLDQTWAFLSSHVPVRATVSAERLARVEAPAYPALAMREAIVNALVHRDYASYSGSISVSLYPSRLEVWNPGGLLEGVSLLDLRRGSVSRPRNPDMAYVFFLRGLVERLGTGTLRIIEECRRAGLPAPQWSEQGNGLRLTLYLRDQASAGLVDLNARVLALLDQLDPGDAIGTSDYQAAYAKEVTTRTARSDLSLLVELGYLERVGQGRGSRYVRTGRELPAERIGRTSE